MYAETLHAHIRRRKRQVLRWGRVSSSKRFSFDLNRLAWLHNRLRRSIAEANEYNETNCDDHADHIVGSHCLRVVSNWQLDDDIANNHGTRAVPSAVCDRSDTSIYRPAVGANVY